MKTRTPPAKSISKPNAVQAERPGLRLGLSAYLETSRSGSGLTLEQLSVATGFPISSLAQWERGERVPATDSYLALRNFYGSRNRTTSRGSA